MKRLQAKHKKLLLELEYLYFDLECHNEIQSEALVEFQKALNQYCCDNNIDYSSDYIQEEERKVKFSNPENVTIRDEEGNIAGKEIRQVENSGKPEEIRKLFKKIAIKTHPDKFSKAEKTVQMTNKEVFLSAKNAVEEENFFKLQQIAMKLGIKLPEVTQERIELMEKEAKQVRLKIKNIKNTVAWVWFDEKLPSQRNNLMKRYASTIFRKRN